MAMMIANVSHAQTKTKEIVSKYKTPQETIDKINQMMGVENATPKKDKKKLVVQGDLSDRKIDPKVVAKVKAMKALNEQESMDYVTEQLLNVANTYRGVRYVWGGISDRGMDCSGFVKTAFDYFNIDLPRTSKEMASRGEKIAKNEAKPGDLIFFKNGGSRVINHVGIVMEVLDDEIIFIHSASSKGVSVNSTKESYWGKNFYQINRVYDVNHL